MSSASAQPAPAATPAVTAPPAGSAPPPVPADPASAPAEKGPTPAAEPRWWELLTVGAFVDAYFSQNWNGPRPAANANRLHPYDQHAGFGLAWFGLDAALQTDSVGFLAQVRFGPSVPNLTLADSSVPGGVGFLQNAYAQWRPSGKDSKLTLIAGKFDTPYGAEVAQSQLNINYTRGILYNLAQPFFHTGLRADITASDVVAFKLLAVNGWNHTIDNNRGKSLGAQLNLTPSDKITLALGWLGGPEQDDTATVTCAPGTAFDGASHTCVASAGAPGSDNPTQDKDATSRWRHLIDLVVDLKPTDKLRLVLNGDYAMDSLPAAAGPHHRKRLQWYGGSVLLRYQLTQVFAAGARGEAVHDKDGFLTGVAKDMTLLTGTITLEAAATKLLLVRIDQRIDRASEKLFAVGFDDTSKLQVTTTLGIVAHTP